ncbi:MAG: hypothetical protein FWE41_02320 [Coriobacteriia bacterium]|nr:hypothetical protein [Coriobacteriia bacterium]MCL2749915.1 hypothetical protein [Coriobacteriia bacterium]
MNEDQLQENEDSFEAGAGQQDEEAFEPEESNSEPQNGASLEAEQPAAPTEASAAVFHRNFKPISKAKLKKARRTRRALITAIILLLIVLVGGTAAGVYYYLNFIQTEPVHTYDPGGIANEGDAFDDRGVVEAMEVPNLTQMFGRTADEVLTLLGADYSITKVDASVGGDPDDEDSQASSATKQIITISYTPQEQADVSSLRLTQKIYLSLGEQGTVIEVYFVSSMDLLDFPFTSFADLVATNESFVRVLTQAGVLIMPDITYTAPSSAEYTEFVDKDANFLKIKKETTTWAGSLVSEVAPKDFEITFTFDYGASGVEDSPDKLPLQRTVYLKLS